jgi:hypothetical protein
MTSYFVRIYFFLLILVLSGCAGGPKVDPPSLSNNEAAGSSGASMDAGVAHDPTGGSSENAAGKEAFDAGTKSDSAAYDSEDDAGSLQEP